MTQKFILRNNPYFELILNEDSFEINNTDYIYKNGVYSLSEIKSIKLIDKKLDWFSTIFGNIIGFFLGGQGGYEVSAAKYDFHFYSGRKVEVKLINCDLEIAKELLEQIQSKIHS